MIPDRSKAPHQPWTPEALLDLLLAMGLAAKTLRHPPVFTVEEARALRGDLPGAHTKNLFLRDKKGRMWLLVALADSKVELKCLARVLGARGLSFASPERLLNIPLEIGRGNLGKSLCFFVRDRSDRDGFG